MRPISVHRSASQSEEARKQHRDAWLIVLGIGCLIILVGNLLGGGAWLVALLVAAVMIGYAFYIERHVDDAEVPGDIKGDSIYYLGLLFTFAALVAALITFDWGAPGGDATGTTGSIRNFGIALLTTIVGLAGRVWFTMTHESPGDIVDTTRSHLEETVSRMKESLDRARDDLDMMANKFRDSSAGLAQMAATIVEGTKKTAETYDALDEYAGNIASATGSLTREMDHLKGVCGACSGTLTTLQSHAEGLGARLDGVQGGIEDRLGRVQGQLDRAAATFEAISRAAEPAVKRVNAAVQGVEGSEAAVAALAETLSGVRESADRAKGALAGIADAVDHHQVLPLWQEAVDQLHKGTRGIRGIGKHAAAMNAQFEGLGESVRAATDGLSSIPGTARGINRQLRGAGPELKESIAPVRELARDLSADLGTARARSAELSTAIGDVRQLARGLSEEMRELASVEAPDEPEVAPPGRIRRALAGMRQTLTSQGRALVRMARSRRRY